jgi:hypothetical protein
MPHYYNAYGAYAELEFLKLMNNVWSNKRLLLGYVTKKATENSTSFDRRKAADREAATISSETCN